MPHSIYPREMMGLVEIAKAKRKNMPLKILACVILPSVYVASLLTVLYVFLR
jgi:hypothetical protein